MYIVLKRASHIAHAIAFLLASTAIADAAGDATKGAVIFQQCSACHSPKQGVNLVGPSLFGVVGRPAGGIASYSYSQAMQEAAKKGLMWTPGNIVNYLQNPHKFLDTFADDPGAPNKMPFMLADPQQRQDVVTYLQTIK